MLLLLPTQQRQSLQYLLAFCSTLCLRGDFKLGYLANIFGPAIASPSVTTQSSSPHDWRICIFELLLLSNLPNEASPLLDLFSDWENYWFVIAPTTGSLLWSVHSDFLRDIQGRLLRGRKKSNLGLTPRRRLAGLRRTTRVQRQGAIYNRLFPGIFIN